MNYEAEIACNENGKKKHRALWMSWNYTEFYSIN